MADLSPTFNVREFENYGNTNFFLTAEQLNSVALTESRVNDQLDWLAQLLGWNGPNYWSNLTSSVAQKRALQTGTFGVYGGYIHPEVVEVRNWDNTVVVKADSRIKAGQTFYLGDYSYLLESFTQEDDTYVLKFDILGEQFFSDLSENQQLKVIAPNSLPNPFFRPEPGTSADASFLCDTQGPNLILYPGYNTEKNLPYKFNTFLTGARYYFDLPVAFSSDSILIEPKYDFSRERWYLDIPSNLTSEDVGLEGALTYDTSTLRVRVSPWSNPSDWVTKEKIDHFLGVWSNKGGKLPFHFVFDALGIHGFNEKISLYFDSTDKTISFSDLLRYVESQTKDPIPNFGAFETAIVYCNGERVFEGNTSVFENFQFEFQVDSVSESFHFLYSPLNYEGSANTPEITISESILSTSKFSLSGLIFGGSSFYMSPNVEDSRTLLRLWKSEPLHVLDSFSELELLGNPNPLRADINQGPGDKNWERYFVRLPPAYGRDEREWQKVNLVCQDFGYWGSSLNPEKMSCPPERGEPRIYEQVVLYGKGEDSISILYSEPYLFSDILYKFEDSEDFNNSDILPGFDTPYDDFYEAELVDYDPLHNRKAITDHPNELDYGDWEGVYLRPLPSVRLGGFLINDLKTKSIETISPPVWDASIYKYPPLCKDGGASATVDSNHYKVGYSHFAADLSASEEGVFDFEGTVTPAM